MSFPPGVLVDPDIEASLGHLNWHACPTYKTGKLRVIRNWKAKGRQFSEYLARRIMQAPTGIEVDHVNLDPLDNRRANLRFATRSQNAQNQPIRSDNTSGYRGVTWDKSKGRWKAQAQLNGRGVFIASFTDKEAAAQAVVAWRREHMPFSEMDKVAV